MTGSPVVTLAATWSARRRQQLTRIRRLGASTHCPSFGSYRRGWVATRNVETSALVVLVTRLSGWCSTVPTTVTYVSNILTPCSSTLDTGGPVRPQQWPYRKGLSAPNSNLWISRIAPVDNRLSARGACYVRAMLASRGMTHYRRGMTKKIAISVPDDVAARLEREPNVSAFVTEAVRTRMDAEEVHRKLIA